MHIENRGSMVYHLPCAEQPEQPEQAQQSQVLK